MYQNLSRSNQRKRNFAGHIWLYGRKKCDFLKSGDKAPKKHKKLTESGGKTSKSGQFLSMDYEKDIFSRLAYDFEPSHKSRQSRVYHQDEVLHIIIAKAEYSLRLMRYTLRVMIYALRRWYTIAFAMDKKSTGRNLSIFGRSDRVRTCGIDIPNVARYQLRHTPIYSILCSDFYRNSATVGHYVVVSLL